MNSFISVNSIAQTFIIIIKNVKIHMVAISLLLWGNVIRGINLMDLWDVSVSKEIYTKEYLKTISLQRMDLLLHILGILNKLKLDGLKIIWDKETGCNLMEKL